MLPSTFWVLVYKKKFVKKEGGHTKFLLISGRGEDNN